MKQTSKMSRAVGQLEKMYNTLNLDFFEGALSTPIVTVQSKPGTWGHCSTAKIWKQKDGETYELNIAAESLSANIEDIIDTLMHEMVHLYCLENGIQDVSRGGKYHNGRFKAEAEKRGLTCFKAGAYGWNTRPGDNLIEYAITKGWTEIIINRETRGLPIRIGATGTAQGTGAEGGEKRPSSTRKYVCPSCGASVRATKSVNIICGDCMVSMATE